MVGIAQLVRASVCGTEGRGFEPHWPPEWGIFLKGEVPFHFQYVAMAIGISCSQKQVC